MNLIRKCLLLLLLSFYLLGVLSEPISDRGFEHNSVIDLPDNFLLGAGTSAFQIEGAWNTSGKSETYIESVMKHFFKNASADTSSDSYHKYQEDVKVLNDTGLNMYRFSMSWARLLPTGGVDNINKEGVEYYHAVLDELEKIGVEPIVMLHHYDHPLILEQSGGWLNDKTIQLYVNYARFVFEEFGDRIKYFITFNEVNMFCYFVYSTNWKQNNRNTELEMTTKAYTCGHNILKAHANVYHMYHNEYNSKKNGKVSISILCENYRPKYKHDYLLSETAFDFGCGWIAHPIYSKTGDYPILMKQRVRDNSKRHKSKLPIFSEESINKIRGSSDFFALSYYSTHLIERAFKNNTQNIYMPSDANIFLSNDPSWVQATNGFYVVPSGLGDILRKIKRKYDNPPVYIIENGYANDGHLNDVDRIQFLYSHLKETLDARKYDNCDVRAYFYWSLIDSFEFEDGFTAHFGLAHVDFEDPNRPRTLKRSAYWLRKVIQSRKLSMYL